MMLTATGLRVIHVTTHIGLIDAIARIDAGKAEHIAKKAPVGVGIVAVEQKVGTGNRRAILRNAAYRPPNKLQAEARLGKPSRFTSADSEQARRRRGD